eukprot:scaffold117128_cov32-Prasinocladus_malaysianus.AAC.1
MMFALDLHMHFATASSVVCIIDHDASELAASNVAQQKVLVDIVPEALAKATLLSFSSEVPSKPDRAFASLLYFDKGRRQ